MMRRSQSLHQVSLARWLDEPARYLDALRGGWTHSPTGALRGARRLG